MTLVDRFIHQLHEVQAHTLVLESDAKVVLITGGGTWPITTKAWTADQIQAVFQEILPAGSDLASADPKGHRFTYTSPHGAVRATFSRKQGRPQLVIQPLKGEVPATEQQAPRPPAAVKAAPMAQAPAQAPTLVGLFQKMIDEGCSDLHISTGNPPLFRKDGDIVTLGESDPLTPDAARAMLLAITPAGDQALFEQQRDVDFSYDVAGLARFRCNLFMDRRGMGGVFRVIPTKIPTAEELGLSKQTLELCHLNKGLIVVTGPTGSGKSTTVAAMIDYINRNINGHLITIEDPIEFIHENRKCLINQREVGHHTKDFKAALRAALREDPDFVLVGEMRDLETVAIAIETAETGHLVFGTLHTNTAASAVDRIIDQFPPDRQAQVRTMLSESLRGVVAQVLCKKKGGGRLAAREVLLVSSAVSNLIREGKTFQIPSIMQASRGLGMVSLNEALHDLVQRGLVDPMEAYGKAAAKSELKALLGRSGVKVEAGGAS